MGEIGVNQLIDEMRRRYWDLAKGRDDAVAACRAVLDAEAARAEGREDRDYLAAYALKLAREVVENAGG